MASCLRRLLASNSKFIHVNMSASPPIDVVHEPKNNRFAIHLDGGDCVLEYVLTKKTLDLYHTEVPDIYMGKGIAKQLVKEAVDYAMTNSLAIKPTCDYVQKYLKENPNPKLKIVYKET